MIPHPPTVVIEKITPLIDGGRYPIKRSIGEDTVVEADIFKDGHDVVSAVLKWRKVGEAKWNETAMVPIPRSMDRWRGTMSVYENAVYEFTIEAWGDFFRSWQHEFSTKFEAGLTDLQSETLEGAGFIERSAGLAAEAGRRRDEQRLLDFAGKIRAAAPGEVNALLHHHELEALMTAWADRSEGSGFLLNEQETLAFVELPELSAPNRAKLANTKEGRGTKGCGTEAAEKHRADRKDGNDSHSNPIRTVLSSDHRGSPARALRGMV